MYSFVCRSCSTMLRSCLLRGSASRPCILVPRASLRHHSRRKSNKQEKSDNPLLNYLRTLKWVPIPLGVGFAYISYQQYGHIVKREEKKLQMHNDPGDLVANDWFVTVYKCLPLKILSRLWGRVNSLELPMWLREPVLKLYIWAFDCNLEEAVIRDLQHYKNLSEFFRRRIRTNVRPVDQRCSVTSPSDGCILHFGRADHDRLEQVKGVTYCLQDFAGPPSWKDTPHKRNIVINSQAKQEVPERLPSKEYPSRLKHNPDNELYHCVIYLAPGDYHGYHSPVEWTVTHRRHFPGELLSVNPGVCRLVKGLFNLNERAIYFGEWEQGFFSMTPVGATNVGSIKVFIDKHLTTNCTGRYPAGVFFDETFIRPDTNGIQLRKGESFGEFNLGSTVVLIFEAPPNFRFKVTPGQKVKFGQPLGCYKESDKSSGA